MPPLREVQCRDSARGEDNQERQPGQEAGGGHLDDADLQPGGEAEQDSRGPGRGASTRGGGSVASARQRRDLSDATSTVRPAKLPRQSQTPTTRSDLQLFFTAGEARKKILRARRLTQYIFMIHPFFYLFIYFILKKNLIRL